MYAFSLRKLKIDEINLTFHVQSVDLLSKVVREKKLAKMSRLMLNAKIIESVLPSFSVCPTSIRSVN